MFNHKQRMERNKIISLEDPDLAIAHKSKLQLQIEQLLPKEDSRLYQLHLVREIHRKTNSSQIQTQLVSIKYRLRKNISYNHKVK